MSVGTINWSHLVLALVLAVIPLAPIEAEAETAAQASSLPWVTAEVKKVDAVAGRLTLKHEEISNLYMPGITMACRAADSKMLEGLKPGDAVRVVIDKVKGQFTVVRLAPAR